MSRESFQVTVHEKERILEVRYPAHPTMASYTAYETEVRGAIEHLAAGGAWDCLVDQTALKALAPEFPPLIAKLNAWAREQGMRHTARVTADSAVGELQSVRILRDSGVKHIGSLFHHRREAWEWLTKDR